MSNNQMVSEILPCPHCGHQDFLIERLDSDASVVICQGLAGPHEACLARGPVGVAQDEGEEQPGRDKAIELWNARAEQHQGEPVAFVEVTGSRPTKYCWMGATRILPVGLHKLYTHADPAEVGEIKKHNAELLGEVDTLTADVERLRAENQSLRKTLPNSTTELVDLRAQLAETHALLRMVYLDEGTTDEKCARVEQIISASAERNQCDGCQAGIPVVNGAHRMGKPGGYSDSMACQAAKYASAEPSAPVERDEHAMRQAFRSWAFNKEGPAVEVMPSEDAALDGFIAGADWQACAALERKP